MNDQAPIDQGTAAPVASIALALAEAQANMGKALKQSSNPHFKSKYADLGSVMDACLPALNEQGIAVIQPTTDDQDGRYVETILIHGESGQELRCRVPLIVGKNDMQGYGSAVTYARRYGLMSMAGIAPEDDDGNAAAKAAPNTKELPKLISHEQYQAIKRKAEDANVELDTISKAGGVSNVFELQASDYDLVMRKLQKTIDEKKPSDSVDADEIPY